MCLRCPSTTTASSSRAGTSVSTHSACYFIIDNDLCTLDIDVLVYDIVVVVGSHYCHFMMCRFICLNFKDVYSLFGYASLFRLFTYYVLAQTFM